MQDHKTRDDLEATQYRQYIRYSRVSRESLVKSLVTFVLVVAAAVVLLLIGATLTPGQAGPSKDTNKTTHLKVLLGRGI